MILVGREMRIMMMNNEGVSNVIGAILAASLFISVFSILYSYYVPNTGASLEYSNMRDVKSQFISMASRVRSDSLGPSDYVTAEMSFNTGTYGFVMGTEIRSVGEVLFMPDGMNMTLRYNSTQLNSSGYIAYVPYNTYYPPQSYIYRWGGVSIITRGGSSFALQPTITYSSGVIKVLMVDLTGSEMSFTGQSAVSITLTSNLKWSMDIGNGGCEIRYSGDTSAERAFSSLLSSSLPDGSYTMRVEGDDIVISILPGYDVEIIYVSMDVDISV